MDGRRALVGHAQAQLLAGHPDAAAGTLRRQLDRWSPGDEGRADLVASLAFAEACRARFVVARDLATDELAGRHEPTRDLASLHAAHALTSAMAGPGRHVTLEQVEARLDLAVRSVALGGDPLGGYLLAEAAMSGGQVALAERVAAGALAGPGLQPGIELSHRHALARSLLFQARLDEAEAACRVLLERARELEHPVLLGVGLGVDAFLAAQRGSRARLRSSATEALRRAGPPLSSYFAGGAYTLCAFAFAADGQHALAAATMLRGAGGPELPRAQWVDRAYGYELLAGGAVAGADLDAAQGWLARCEHFSGGGMATAALERTRALVTTALGDADGGIVAAERAQAAAAGAGGNIDAARARVLRGTALSRAGARRGALDELQEVAAVASALGAVQIRRQAARELRRLGRRVRVDGSGWSSLTTREREVAVLVADGLTSRQVARSLQVSERTVHSHLAAVMRALGTTSRAALPLVVPRQRSGQSPALGALTRRQSEVVALVATGLTNRQIAERLLVSPKTVEKHVADVFARWQVTSRTALAARWGSGDDLLALADDRDPRVGHPEAAGPVVLGVEADLGPRPDDHVLVEDRPADAGAAADVDAVHEHRPVDLRPGVHPHAR